MKFKEIRDLIFTDCNVIKGKETTKVATHEPTTFDEDEVIGIRSRNRMINGYNVGSYIEVLVK